MTQAEALRILTTGANVFLTGEPGAGKTHTINAYTKYLRQRGVSTAITASTGIAATHIGGFTIHSWSGIGIANRLDKYLIDKISSNERVVKRVERAKVLVIDEVSMLGPETLSLVDAVLRDIKRSPEPFGGLQIILVGDFFQLPPIQKNDSLPSNQPQKLFAAPPQGRFAYDSPVWKKLQPVVCYLTEQHRQDDPDFLKLLTAIRGNSFASEHARFISARKIEATSAPERVPKLFSHNLDVDRVNDVTLAKLPGETKTFVMSAHGPKALVESLKKGCLSPEQLKLKVGATVMFTKNNPSGDYVNGTLGVVEYFTDPGGLPVVVTRGGKHVEAQPVGWTVEDNGRVLASVEQLPLRLAWAITVHKSQGMSMDEAVMDLSAVFEYGQGYVALSRVRRLSGVHLLGWNERAFMVHPEVLEKDKEFRAASSAATEAFGKLPEADLQTMRANFIKASGGAEATEGGHNRNGVGAQNFAPTFRGNKTGEYFDEIRKTHPNAYQPWEPEQDEELKKLFSAGTSANDIAKTFGRKPGAIRSRLVRIGLVEHRRDVE